MKHHRRAEDVADLQLIVDALTRMGALADSGEPGGYAVANLGIRHALQPPLVHLHTSLPNFDPSPRTRVQA